MTSPTREDWHSLLIERDRLLEWNHRVSVCKDHTPEIVDGPCVICDLDHYKALCEELREKLDNLQACSASVLNFTPAIKNSLAIDLKYAIEIARAALKKAEQAPKP
jgi:hypothetical protein